MTSTYSPWLQINMEQARREIQTSWSHAERARRRQVAECRQRVLLQLLDSAGFEKSRRQIEPATPAA
jgi:hypothetical protein